MKHTKTNIVRLLEAMEENERFIAHDTKNAKLKHDMYIKSAELFTVLNILKDKEFFNHLCEIYEITETEV